MRYKFRGKRIDTLKWAYGFYLETQMSGVFILGSEIETKKRKDGITMKDKLWQHEVLPESVGQWTGLVDRNGKEIFEGDVIYGENYLFPVYDFRKMAVTWNEKSGGFDMDIFDQENIEIIGNIHDNPELMEA